jgi:4-hydroxybutyryl-CoA dehydratase/vinylacetyl-CoA-Delta-isomerase
MVGLSGTYFGGGSRLSHDLAGGFLPTMPESKSFDNPVIGHWLRKYHAVNPEYDVMDHVRFGRFIENMTCLTTMVEATHGAGSPQAQRISILGLADLDEKIRMADRVILGTGDAEVAASETEGDTATQ